ncbi:MAG: hypothetical protein OXH57_00360 [Ekhidna sp.]|nr:hypothetical protein [Ekhidna sp.]
MKNIIIYCIIAWALLAGSCSGDEISRRFVYTVENELASPVTVIFYANATKRNEIERIAISPKDSVVIYDCFRLNSEGGCRPFHESGQCKDAEFGSIIFVDGKRLEFSKPKDFPTLSEPDYNLFIPGRYDEQVRLAENLFVNSYVIDTTEYLLAK